MELNTIQNTDALSGLKLLPDQSIDCCISSPPFWALRKYLNNDDPNKKYELGQEKYFKDYINNLCEIYKEVHRVLKDTGTCFVNLGETWYGGSKGGGVNPENSRKQLTNIGSVLTNGKYFMNNELPKSCMCNIPERFAIKMTDDVGFIQRNTIIWHKPNQFPFSGKNRFTHDYEQIFFFTKKTNGYYFNQQFEPYQTKYDIIKDYVFDGTKTPMRNKRAVWSINTAPNRHKHYAMYPLKLIEPLILCGCPPDGIVMDIFMGAGSTAIASKQLGRNYLGFELSKDYCQIARDRIQEVLI